MKVTLQLRRDETRRRPADARLLLGASVEVWLEELAEWQVNLSDARLFVVPTSAGDPRPCGALVIGVKPRDGHASPRSISYAAVARRLYLPCDARLDPEPTDAELAALVNDEACLWHPQAGLVRLPASAARRVSELLIAPPTTSSEWSAAAPGIALNGKMTSIEPIAAPTAQDVLDSGRGDIGTQPLDLSQLPPAPNEPASGMVADVGRALGSALAKAAQWLAAHAPSGASAPTWLNALGDWADRRLRKLSESLTAARQREINRLMNLLQTNPDEGLRFALPMSGDAHRGIAPPSSVLGPRDVNFSLGGLGGGRPADVWNVDPDLQRRLLEQYRRLASREIALGRHRRAAYIYAALLGEFHLAATTLESGGHFREAAALYEQRLHQPERAAECLRKGRCWPEAVALFERLGRHETVGDIYAELEQREEAEAAWRRAVAEWLRNDNVLAAAKLIEMKLGLPDEAFERLTSAWPTSQQAQRCLTEAFGLAGRQGRHEQAARLVDSASEHHRNTTSTVALAEVLSQQAVGYPDEDVRRRAADRTRVAAAERLGARIETSEAGRLVAAVERLVPADRLLPRDTHRFLNDLRRRPSQQVAERPRAGSAAAMFSLHRKIRFPQLDWKTAVATDRAIYAAGFRDRELVVARTDWDGTVVEEPIGLKWQMEYDQAGASIFLVADPADSAGVIVHVGGAQPVANSRYFNSSFHSTEPVAVGSHPGVTPYTHGVCRCGRDVVHAINWSAGPSFVVNGFLAGSPLSGTSSLPVIELANRDVGEVHLPLPMAVLGETLYVGIGRILWQILGHTSTEFDELPAPITQLVASAPHTRERLAVATELGGRLYWSDKPSGAHSSFASEMDSPQITLARDGTLIAVTAEEIEFYSTGEGRLRLRGRTPASGAAPLAVLSTRQLNRFALFSADGSLTIHNLTPA